MSSSSLLAEHRYSQVVLNDGAAGGPHYFADPSTASSALQDPSSKARRCKKFLIYAVVFAFGAMVASAIIIIVQTLTNENNGHSESGWNAADYVSNDVYYTKRGTPSPFGQIDNMRVDRLLSPQLAPNGRLVLFLRTQSHMPDANQTCTTIWFIRLPKALWNVDAAHLQDVLATSITPLSLTKPIWGVHDSQPQWSADSRSVIYLSNRLPPYTQHAIMQSLIPTPTPIPASQLLPVSTPLLWLSSLFSTSTPSTSSSPHPQATSPSSQQQSASSASSSSSSSLLGDDGSSSFAHSLILLSVPLDITNVLLAPTGNLLAFSVHVYPNSTIEQTSLRLLQLVAQQGLSPPLRFDKLFVRHWDEYLDGRRSHPFVIRITSEQETGLLSTWGSAVDLLYGVDADSPTRPFGGPEQWSFSLSSSIFAFTRQHDEVTSVAWSTNLDIYTVQLSTSSPFSPLSVTAPQCQTCSNLAADTNPIFSPTDENTFAYMSTMTPGYESDRYRVRLMSVVNGAMSELNANWSLSASSLAWHPSGRSLYVTAQDAARVKLFRLTIQQPLQVVPIFQNGTTASISVSRDGLQMVYLSSSFRHPATVSIYFPENRTAGVLTTFNKQLLAFTNRSTPHDFWFAGYASTQPDSAQQQQLVQAFYFPPVAFQPGNKYPVALLIHGGPEDAWRDDWSFRWNPHVYASAGFNVLLINPTGSTGYGQAFVDAIRGEYGNATFHDLMMGLDAALNQFSLMDATKQVALGASFGGYMVNWIAGQTKRFKALVCHDGMFDMRIFGYATDELWFPEHDMEGSPYSNAASYEEFNPADFVSAWSTPLLTIHGGLDYRVGIEHALSAFSTAQRRGVPSRLLYFPDQNHWILDPRHSILWHNEVMEWITQYTR